MAVAACAEYKKGGYDFGILLCGTGIGISIAANKIDGIRCALVHDRFTATMAREHNDANFLAMGGRVEYPIPRPRYSPPSCTRRSRAGATPSASPK
jgi:ribose 5-phosphate isomerase B